MKQPMISVIMSVYNADLDILRESIQSILDQSYSNFEFIIIDDASDINLIHFIDQFSDERINFKRNTENKGLTKSLNFGISLARGKYIARMDADDVSKSTRFEKQINYLKNNVTIGVLGTAARRFGSKNNLLKYPTEHEEIKAGLITGSRLIHPSVMIKANLLKENLYNENFRTAQDYELWSRLIWKTCFSNLDESLIKYRVHNEQVSFKKKDNQTDMAIKIRKNMLDKIDENISQEKIELFSKVQNSELSSKDDLIKLKNLSNQLIVLNKEKMNYSEEALIKIFSENLDKANYVYAKNNRLFPVKNLEIKPYHVNNRFSFQKYLGLPIGILKSKLM